VGHGFSGIGRKRLLNILQERALALGVRLEFETEAKDVSAYADYDLIVGADGANSRVRAAHADIFKPDIDVRTCKYIWLGTHQKFDDAFTFYLRANRARLDLVPRLQFDADTATFIVECSEETWRCAGSTG
jgi:anthraniloyl-CoA monooxygenase